MKKTSFFNVLMLAMAVSAWPGAALAASLLEVYQQALQSDPLIHEAESRRLAALEASPQARSVLLPQLNASGSYDSSEDSGSRVQFDGTGFRPIDSESESDTTSWNVELRQSLFRWDQWVSLRQADKRVAQAEVNYELAQQDLIVRVVTDISRCSPPKTG